MKGNIVINSNVGEYREEYLDGRKYLVAPMKIIQGDTVMNKILYPNDEVLKSVEQLEKLKMPYSHPIVDDDFADVNDPVALNKSYIGAFAQNITVDGKNYLGEMWIDEEIANSSDKGKLVIDKLVTGDKLGVSIMGQAKLKAESGTGEDGKDYAFTSSNYKWNHIAILTSEKPAGDHVNTVVMNEELIEQVETVEKTDETIENKGGKMTKEAVVEFLKSLDATQIEEIFNELQPTEKEISVEEAEEVMNKNGKTVVANSDFEEFKQFKAEQERELNELRVKVANASGIGVDMLNALGKEALVKLANKLTVTEQKGIDNSFKAGKVVNSEQTKKYDYGM